VVHGWYSKELSLGISEGFQPSDQATVKDLMNTWQRARQHRLKDSEAAIERTSGTSAQDEVQYLAAYDGDILFVFEE
jgi:hypothetical protein